MGGRGRRRAEGRGLGRLVMFSASAKSAGGGDGSSDHRTITKPARQLSSSLRGVASSPEQRWGCRGRRMRGMHPPGSSRAGDWRLGSWLAAAAGLGGDPLRLPGSQQTREQQGPAKSYRPGRRRVTGGPGRTLGGRGGEGETPNKARAAVAATRPPRPALSAAVAQDAPSPAVEAEPVAISAAAAYLVVASARPQQRSVQTGAPSAASPLDPAPVTSVASHLLQGRSSRPGET